MTLADMAFVCPVCRTDVCATGAAYACGGCGRTYPVILGIPDFRVTPDPWLSIEADREKGLALDARTRGQGVAATVDAYWQMTPTTTAERAERFAAHVIGAERRSGEWLESEGLTASGDGAPWIDLGCGTADLAVLAARGLPVIAVDIAFRWLVVARRRVEERGTTDVVLVCADAGALPLRDAAATRVVSLGLLEHVRDHEGVLREAYRVLARGGRVHVRVTNRYSLLPEPHVRVWGVGFLPRRLADSYVRWRSGEPYLHLRPPSAGELRRSLSRAGFRDIAVGAATALPSDLDRLGAAGSLGTAYNHLARRPVAGRALGLIAPLLEARARRA
ncbi:MAG: methyltransferase domain-containing protein [Acidobacteriota bacterium]